MSARYLVGDVFDRLAEIPDGSVDLVMTSPPFLALRSYLPPGHPDKGKEIGQEATPADFLDTLLALSAEWRRVLAPHGSICVELGDTYSGSYIGASTESTGDNHSGGPRLQDRRRTATRNAYKLRDSHALDKGWPLAKSLTGIPTLYAWSLAYGRNLLNPEHTIDPWRIRNVIAWVRPNPPVGALGDKFRPATSYLTVACVSGKRYFDLDAVRTPAPRHDNKRAMSTQYQAPGQPERKTRAEDENGRIYANEAGAPPLDWWEIPTQPYAGSHYATYPEALVVRPIEAMCPRRVCTVCGEPSRRIVETTNAVGKAVGRASWRGENGTEGIGQGHSGEIDMDANDPRVPDVAERVTLGWTDCGHDDWRPGLVLDPFAGSGTTLAVATARGRDAIGIDLDARNLDLARDRIGMWLEDEPRGAA